MIELPSILHDEFHDAIQAPHAYNEPQHLIRILHIDDQPDQLQLVKLFLEREDPAFQVDFVSSGKKALERLKEQQYDCIVSDYMMPGMDGINLAYRIREISDVPFVLYTGHGSEEVASAAFAAGIDDYMRKEMDPSHYEVLAKRIRTAVEKRRIENALIESERKYRSLVHDSRDGIMVFTGEELVFANQQAAALHGCGSVEELVEVMPGSLLHPDDKEYIEERSLARQRGEEVSPVTDFRLVWPDGTVRYIESSSSLIQYNGKNSTLAFIRDITSRIQYEKRLEALYSHATELSRSATIKDMAEMTFDAIEQVLGFNLVNFSIVDANLLRDVSVRGIEPVEGYALPLDGPGITVRAVNTGETQLVSDTRLDEDFTGGLSQDIYGSLSELAVPVKIGGEVVAVINVESIKPDAFTEEDRRLLEIFAEYVASTIRGLREQAERQRYEERLEALHAHATDLGRAESLDDVFKLTLDTMEETLGLQTADILVIEGNRLRQVERGGFFPLDRELHLDGRGVTVRAVNTQRSQRVPDVRKDVDYVGLHRPDMEKTLSELAVPVCIGDEAVAVLNVESTMLDAYNENDQRLLETLAEHVASAISRLRHVEILRASEEKWRILLEESMDAVSVIVGLKIVYVNQSYVKLLGLGDPSEAIGRNALDFAVVEDRERIRRMAIGRQRGEDHPTRYEFKMMRADGTRIDVENYVTDIEYKGEKASLSFVRDITERKKAEQKLLEYSEHLEEMVDERTRKLRDREEQLKILFEYAPDAIYINDLKGNFIDGNKAAEKMTGYNRDKLIGKSFLKINLLPLKQIPKAAMLLAKNALGQPTGPDEFTLNRKDGGQVTVEIRTYPIKIKGQISVLGIARDITERKRLEEELMFAERITVAGRVAAMVGHDLRGPLQTIKNAVYMLKRSPDSTNKMLEMIDGAVHRANQMLEEFRSQTRDTPLNLVSTDLAALINASVEEAQAPNSVNVVVNIGDGLEDVSVDPQKMRRVLDNLLENAVDAKPDSVIITVSAERTEDKVTIKVSDTGVGISNEEILDLFKPFHTTKRKGLGLGLAYCKQAVEAHSGTITVESEVGKGTTFTINIPIETPRKAINPN